MWSPGRARTPDPLLSTDIYFKAGTVVNDFTVADVMLPTAGFPFRDDFALVDGSRLDRFWDAQSGNFTVKGGHLVVANSVNTTTLRAALATGTRAKPARSCGESRYFWSRRSTSAPSQSKS